MPRPALTYGRTAIEALSPRNEFGLYDTAGNVWKWVQDCWHDSYKGVPANGSAWETGDCDSRVVRGGSWVDLPARVRSAYRLRLLPDTRDYDLGFRLAQDP